MNNNNHKQKKQVGAFTVLSTFENLPDPLGGHFPGD